MNARYIFKLLISVVSVLISLTVCLLMGETAMRIQRKGFSAGLKSFWVTEPPFAVLGTNNKLIYDDQLGYRLNPAQPGINRFSMKEGNIAIPKPDGVKRIIILGDSVPFIGDPTFVDLLKAKFKENPHIEILNASTTGYTTYQELIFLKRYLLQMDPDAVVLCYVMNDNHKFLHRFDEKAQMLFTPEARESVQIHNAFDKFVSQSYLLSFIKGLLITRSQKIPSQNTPFWWDDASDFNTAWKDEYWGDFDAELQEMDTLLQKQNGKLLVTIFPIESQIDDVYLDKDYQYVLKPQKKVAYYSEKYNIPYLDLFLFLYEARKENLQDELYMDGLHLTTRGHTVVADALYKFLVQNLKL